MQNFDRICKGDSYTQMDVFGISSLTGLEHAVVNQILEYNKSHRLKERLSPIQESLSHNSRHQGWQNDTFRSNDQAAKRKRLSAGTFPMKSRIQRVVRKRKRTVKRIKWKPTPISRERLAAARELCKNEWEKCVKLMPDDEIEQNLRQPSDKAKPYRCVLGCGYSCAKECDWKRHDNDNRPTCAWVCGVDVTVCDVKGTPGRRCSFCGLENPDSSHRSKKHPNKNACSEKKMVMRGLIFTRADKFMAHFNTVHTGLDVDCYRGLAEFNVCDNFNRHCGFCGLNFNAWKEWASHVLHQLERREGDLSGWVREWKGPQKLENCAEDDSEDQKRDETERCNSSDKRDAYGNGDEDDDDDDDDSPDEEHDQLNDQDSSSDLDDNDLRDRDLEESDDPEESDESHSIQTKRVTPGNQIANGATFVLAPEISHHLSLYIQSIIGGSLSAKNNQISNLSFKEIMQIEKHLKMHPTSPLTLALSHNIDPGGFRQTMPTSVLFIYEEYVDRFMFHPVRASELLPKVLGKGGASTVYRIRLPRGMGDVAMKTTSKCGSCKSLQEAKIILSVNHHHIIQCRGILLNADTCAIIVSPVARYTLQQVLDDPHMRKEIHLENFGSIALAISHLHRHNIIHADIKPSNILVVQDSWIITDFGASRTIGCRCPTSYTKKYAAPEVLDSGLVTAAADVFSYAMTMIYSIAKIIDSTIIASLTCYGENLALLHQWLDVLSSTCYVDETQRELNQEIINVLRCSISETLKDRPTASDIAEILPADDCCTQDYDASIGRASLDYSKPIQSSHKYWTLYSVPMEKRNGHWENFKSEPHGTLKYSPLLGKSDIRLVSLLPGGSLDDIELKIITVSLSDNPTYEAMSYAWGESRSVCSISVYPDDNTKSTCEPQKLLIQSDLFQALQVLRYPKRERRLWIQSVCINQKDLDEKSNQVCQMYQIFAKAQGACIWLGGCDSAYHKAMDTISKVSNIEKPDNNWLPLDPIEDKETFRNDIQERWHSLVDLMRRPWFSRRWVVQEIAFSRKASIYCGHMEHNWKDFLATVAFFTEYLLPMVRKDSLRHEHLLIYEEPPNVALLLNITSYLIRWEPEKTGWERSWHLETLVMYLSSFDVSDPRDIIFSLISLAKDVTPFTTVQTTPKYKQAMVALYSVTYSKTVMQIYIEFVEHCIRTNYSLDIICRRWVPFKEYKQLGWLPSWIGIIGEATQIGLSQDCEKDNAHCFVGLPGRPIYNASRRRPRAQAVCVKSVELFPRGHKSGSNGCDASLRSRSSQSPSKRISLVDTEYTGELHVTGILIGTVRKNSSPAIKGTISENFLKNLGWNRRMIEGPKAIPDQIWRCLVADRGDNGQNPPSWYPRACSYCFVGYRGEGDINFQSMIDDPGKSQRVVEFSKRVQTVVCNRRSFVCWTNTDEKLVGVGPESMQLGDKIALLFGCAVPVILRKLEPSENEAYFTLIGDCYVHGVMDGQALHGKDEVEIDRLTRTFILR
jgi:serine/threonine protein kinase